MNQLLLIEGPALSGSCVGVLHKPVGELLSDPNIERLFLSGAHAAPAAAAAV